MEALTSAQKAAIIISSIGTENASEVFKHFSDEEVEQITLEIARMNYSLWKWWTAFLTSSMSFALPRR